MISYGVRKINADTQVQLGQFGRSANTLKLGVDVAKSLALSRFLAAALPQVNNMDFS